MAEVLKLHSPVSREDLKNLKAGDRVLLSGTIITGRDAAQTVKLPGNQPLSVPDDPFLKSNGQTRIRPRFLFSH